MELYPDDADLLALTGDEQTGVEFIETGKAPYYVEFRRMLHRLLANLAPLGLRVHKTGDLAVQVKPGRYWLGGTVHEFSGTDDDLALANNDTNYVYLDDAGEAQAVTDSAGWPTGEHVRLAIVTTAAGAFAHDDIVDLRGESMQTSLTGLTATVEELNRLAGVSAEVTAENLDTLTGGDDVGLLHLHNQLRDSLDGGHRFGPTQTPGGDIIAAHTAQYMGTPPAAMLDYVSNGTFHHWLRHDSDGVHVSTDGDASGPGAPTTLQRAPVHLQVALAGEITADATGHLLGVVPADGAIEDVILSVQENGSDSVDALDITATVSVNGTAVCTVDPAIDKTAAADAFATTAAAGSGITQATVKSDGTEDVSKGDILSVDLALTRTTPDTEITGPVVLVKIRPTAAD